MITQAEIKKLPTKEKLKVMSMIWDELKGDETNLDSPLWHETELKSTEDRSEQPLDWNSAKDMLRQKRG